MARKKGELEKMIEEKYGDPELAARLLQDIEANRTRGQIEHGELKLPDEDDARRHFERVDAQERERNRR